jgi:hypothetical protein
MTIKEKNPVFAITDIPKAMRGNNWAVAARLMERWFSAKAYAMSSLVKDGSISPLTLDKSLIDTNIVTMSWALKFDRVSAASAQLTKTWATPNGLKRLYELVRAQGITRLNTKWAFGDPLQATYYLDKTCQVNFVTFGNQLKDPLDDLFGAIGKGTLKIAVFGQVDSSAKDAKHVLTIEKIGLYIRDAYDFNDDSSISQPLGYWGFSGVESFKLMARDVPLKTEFEAETSEELNAKRYRVTNASFQNFRKETSKGGDFLIYSDLHLIKLDKPIQYVIPL